MPKKAQQTFPLLTYIDELVESLRGHVPQAMKEWDADAIHQSRVATRRLKAAVDLLQPVLSEDHRKPFGRVLKKLRRRLGPMRDLDVMIEHLGDLKTKSHASTIAWLQEKLQKERESAREKLAVQGASGRVLSRLGTWWGLREEVEDAREAADSLLAESLHSQLDSFAEQADRLSSTGAAGKATGASRQDPHAVRIAGKNFRYTLEMAAAQGHKLPSGIVGSFKRMQESLGMWHDYVVLTERAMQVSLSQLLAHHDAELQGRILDLSRTLLRKSAQHLDQFSSQWAKGGCEVAQAVRQTFPLTRDLNELKKDPDPPGSDDIQAPAASPPDAISTA